MTQIDLPCTSMAAENGETNTNMEDLKLMISADEVGLQFGRYLEHVPYENQEFGKIYLKALGGTIDVAVVLEVIEEQTSGTVWESEDEMSVLEFTAADEDYRKDAYFCLTERFIGDEDDGFHIVITTRYELHIDASESLLRMMSTLEQN
jgi:hypothetical protein